jgi:hypothetical protein
VVAVVIRVGWFVHNFVDAGDEVPKCKAEQIVSANSPAGIFLAGTVSLAASELRRNQCGNFLG